MYLSFAYFLKRRRIFLELNSQGLHPVSKREEKNVLMLLKEGDMGGYGIAVLSLFSSGIYLAQRYPFG